MATRTVLRLMEGAHLPLRKCKNEQELKIQTGITHLNAPMKLPFAPVKVHSEPYAVHFVATSRRSSYRNQLEYFPLGRCSCAYCLWLIVAVTGLVVSLVGETYATYYKSSMYPSTRYYSSLKYVKDLR